MVINHNYFVSVLLLGGLFLSLLFLCVVVHDLSPLVQILHVSCGAPVSWPYTSVQFIEDLHYSLYRFIHQVPQSLGKERVHH